MFPFLAAFLTPLALSGWFEPDRPNELVFPPTRARHVRLVLLDAPGAEPCIDELEVYAPEGGENLALATRGARASASSCLAGYAIHRIEHLNDGRYGNSQSWIAAGTREEWAQIELPRAELVAKVVFSRDREGRYRDRMPGRIEVRVSEDGERWTTVLAANAVPTLPDGTPTEEELLRYAFEHEDLTWRDVEPGDPVVRILRQTEGILDRLARQGLDVDAERAESVAFRKRHEEVHDLPRTSPDWQQLWFDARLAKRRLFLRSPELEALERILFVKRHPFEPSHNYSVILDAAGPGGGGICVLKIPRPNGRLEPDAARITTLFDAGDGFPRDPVATFDGETVFFSFRPTKEDYFRIHRVRADGSDLQALADGPFHDYFPCPLPDGGLAFTSTRCRARFLCWRPQAFVLFRMEADGSDIRPLSHANLSEWTPAVMRDGRILWMRSEYLDKGADFGHTLWAIRPDGTHPELVFGNNTLNCYANGREVPGTDELLCTLVSHGGDLNGPLALIDLDHGPFDPAAITNITPDVEPHYHMSWARSHCFRDPYPIGRDLYLASHAPYDRFGLYVVDRYGNRELVYLDPEMGSMSPSPLRPVPRPSILGQARESVDETTDEGMFFMADVYRGLEGYVERGSVKYIRVCEEVRAGLLRLENGEYQNDHEPFQDWYATPTHKVQGPHGWPSYVAKSVLGIAPVEEDGSASFRAPAGKVLYFQALDADLNELQRMRSVVQLQPGETRGCIGCHEDRGSAPPSMTSRPLALRREPSRLLAPSWGAGPFGYEEVVQPVWDARCVGCHDGGEGAAPDLTASLDRDGVPTSYRSLVEGGWMHHFDFMYGREHEKAAPRSFGTLRSGIWPLLEGGHHDVRLTRDEMHRVKCWTDLNCPLWPDYRFRLERPGVEGG